MLLREFLYVDSDKVRGLLAQMDEGIIESATEVERAEKDTSGGLKGLAAHSQRWGTERAIQKSQGDALFPALETALESLGLLVDLSQDLQDPDFWSPDTLQQVAPAGTLVRITASGALFDARYIAATLAAFATSWQGLANLGVVPAATPTPLKKGQQGSQRPKQPRRTEGAEPSALEDAIPEVHIQFPGGSSEVSAAYLRGIVQVARGMFTPGLHLNMQPTGADSHAVTARLQEGRQFLDSDADVLFARYGGAPQEWTLVGSVGHFGKAVDQSVTKDPGLADARGVNRSRFASFVNGFMSYLGTLGFIDVPQEPGFSVVPLAVYRVVGRSAVKPDEAGWVGSA